MTPFRYGLGAGLALLAAGPVFTLLLFGTWLIGPGEMTSGVNGFAALLMLLPFALIIGMILGVIPIVFGGLLMGWLGASAIWARHPIIWATAGGIIGMLMGLAFDAMDQLQTGMLFVLTGAICALIVRYGTRWSDDSV